MSKLYNSLIKLQICEYMNNTMKGKLSYEVNFSMENEHSVTINS